MRSKFIISIFLLALASQAMADLPVHCLKHHIVGTWEFAITSPMSASDPYKMNCGHELPDNAANSYLAMSNTFKPSQTFTVKLSGDNVANSNELGRGTWTMIYDEAMDVTIDKHRFTAFFSYFPNESGKVLSYCGKTVVGWFVETSSGKKSCFRAEKKVSDAEAEDLYVEPLTQMYVVQPEDTVTLLQTPRDTKFLQTQHKEALHIHKAFSDHDAVVHHLNNKVEKSWTAKNHDMFEGKTVEQLNKMAGRKKASVDGMERRSLKNEEMLQKQSTDDLPKSFDWRKKLPSPRQQLDCGSCYVFATMAMLESRIKIKYDKNVILSPQHVLDCSFFNQGCDGGYPFLVEKFGSEFELVEESCSPYRGTKGACNTCNTQKLSQVYKIKDYKFVGGAYGKSNEKNMMEELLHNGPIVVSFEPTYDFMYYSGGIFHSVDADWVKSGSRPEWERVDHSVLLYGWGETDDGQKYWLLMNSWGTDWGEAGHFRMKRGVDESAVESLAEAADPIIVSRG